MRGIQVYERYMRGNERHTASGAMQSLLITRGLGINATKVNFKEWGLTASFNCIYGL